MNEPVQETQETRVQSWKWQSAPVFLPEKSHGQRSLVGVAESDRTE